MTAPLLVYYGWPSCINGAADPAAEFDRYTHVVLGAGLEDPGHPDHYPTLQIVHDTTARVYGYIDVGMATSHYTIRRIRRSMRRWKQTGAVGVMLDDFGFDWGVSPRRQRRSVAEAHLLDLEVIANVWEPPANLAPNVGADFLLCEGFYIDCGIYDPGWAERAAGYEGRVMSVATAGLAPFRQDLFNDACRAAERLGHVAFAWGERDYSADGRAPWRERP